MCIHMHNVWGQCTLHKLLWTFLSLHYVLLHISLSLASYTDRQIIYADTTDCLTSFTYSVCVCVCVYSVMECVHTPFSIRPNWPLPSPTPQIDHSVYIYMYAYTCIMHNACIYCNVHVYACIYMYTHVYTCMLCVKCGFARSAVREYRPACLIVAALSRDT